MDYIGQFSDQQLRELRDNADEMFREVYIAVADLPKVDWPAIKIRHLKDLKNRIAEYDTEIMRRRTLASERERKPESTNKPKSTTQIPAANAHASPRAAKLFISYAHADEPLKKVLDTHLALLTRIGVIETWSDRQLMPGQRWDDEIRSSLDQADIILLLISANFFASNYCYDDEAKRALQRLQAEGTVVVPVVLTPVDWALSPLASLQALPPNARPITTWPNQEEGWSSVAAGIRHVAQQLNLT